VSGLDRRLLLEDGWSIEGILQTDAEINHGNSGGPLVDINGEVLGVNTAIRRDGRGVGFAVPADTVLSIVPELIEHQRILRPRLGVTIDVIEHHADGISRERLRVCDVADARSSSFEPGDILLSIAGREVWSRADLFRTLRRPLIDSATTVVVERSTQLISLEIRCSASDEPASAE
jgi:S1-C subfamily serine protease